MWAISFREIGHNPVSFLNTKHRLKKKKMDPRKTIGDYQRLTRPLCDGAANDSEAAAAPLVLVVALRPILVLIWSGPFFL
jgi:hypothetical protein